MAQVPESLPVLDAFREFLEAERRRTRRRMQAMAFSFITVLVLVVAGGLAMIHNHLSRISSEYGVIRKALEEDAALFDHRTAEAVLRVGQTAQKTQQAVDRAEKAARSLRSDLDRQSQALSAAEGNFGTQLGMQSNTLGQMHALLAVLQTENATLQNHLQAFQSGLPTLTDEMEAVRALISDLRSLPVQPVAPVGQPVAPRAATSEDTAGHELTTKGPMETLVSGQAHPPMKAAVAADPPPTENLSLLIVPHGGKHPARWKFRVPVVTAAPSATALNRE